MNSPDLSTRPTDGPAPSDPVGPTEAGALHRRGVDAYREGSLEEARDLLERAARGGRADARPATLLALGRTQRDLGQFDAATASFDQALELAGELGDLQTESDALNLKAGLLDTQGQHAQALLCLGEALAVVRPLGRSEREAIILTNVGSLHLKLGDYAEALHHLMAAYDQLHQVAPLSRSMATNLVELGRLYRAKGDAQSALDFFERAREVGLSMQDAAVEAVALNNLAVTRSGSGECAKALELFEEALRLTRRLGLRQFEIDNLDGLGQVYASLERFDQAVAAHLEALTISREIGDHEGEMDALLNLGRDKLSIGAAAEAVEVLLGGLEIAERIGRRRAAYEAHALLADAFERTGAFELALGHHRAFQRAKEEIFNEDNERKTRAITVQFDLERARHEAEQYRLRTELAQEARAEAEAAVLERTRELEESQVEVVTRLAVAAEHRDDDTGEHTRRVGRNAAALAYLLGWSEEDVRLLYTAARLHDVGKIAIPDAILLKPGRLRADEQAVMREHTSIGAKILSDGKSRLLKLAETIALAHHERWDGSGYPQGLAGAAIPAAARIVAVADVLDALTHERPYKGAWNIDRTLNEIEALSGSQFDPTVVAACLEAFGGGRPLSPLEVPPDWPSTLKELRAVARQRGWRQQISFTIRPGDESFDRS